MSGAFQHLTLQPVPPPVPACAQPPRSSRQALGAEQSQALGLVLPLPPTRGQATKALEVPMSQPGDERSPCACSLPSSTGQHAALGPLAGAARADQRAGGHALLQGSSSAQVTFPPTSGSPECLNVLTPLVGTSTHGPGPLGGCKWVSSAPSPADAGSAACSPLGHRPAAVTHGRAPCLSKAPGTRWSTRTGHISRTLSEPAAGKSRVSCQAPPSNTGEFILRSKGT